MTHEELYESKSQMKRVEILKAGEKQMFFCKNCGHPDSVHTNWAGKCIHGDLKPKDGLDCDCEQMK